MVNYCPTDKMIPDYNT